MNVSDQIRASLKQCGEPMTVEQLSDANGWERPERNIAYTLLGQMKKRGEILMSLAEGKAHYALAIGYVPKRGRPPNKEKPAPKKRDRVSETAAVAPVAKPAAPAAEPSANETPTNHDELQQWSMQRQIDRGKPGKALVVSDFDLRRRLDAIATDAEDALEDALKVGLKTEFLQQLHQASVAINRAARAYVRS